MNNPEIEWVKNCDRHCLKFTFKGSLTVNDAAESIKVWEKYFNEVPDEKIPIVWDCLEMKGYDKKSRELWQKALKKMRDRVDVVWLITNSSMVRMGASLVSLFAAYKINVISSEAELPLNQKSKSD